MYIRIDPMTTHPTVPIKPHLILATCVVLLFSNAPVSWGAAAPILRCSGNTPIFMQNGQPITVDPYIELYSPDGSLLTNVIVKIENVVTNQDRLLYTNPVTGVTGLYVIASGKLTLYGRTNDTVFQEALRRVKYQNTSNNVIVGTRTIIFNAGGGDNYLSETRHFYQFISSSGITWSNAYKAATQRVYFGCQGYLMTVTSAAENAFALTQLNNKQGWMGASDNESNKIWKWVSGPETGQHFFTQSADAFGCGIGGTNVPGMYSNWSTDEPNDWKSSSDIGCEHGEDYAHFYANGLWNDYPNNNSSIQGYIVEYGGYTNEPALDFADATQLQVQKSNTAPGTPTLVSPVNCPNAGGAGPSGDNLNLYGRTQNSRPKFIWVPPADVDTNKLNFSIWIAAGQTNAGTTAYDSSVSGFSNFTYFIDGSWTDFPSGGVTNYNVGYVGYQPSNNLTSAYTDLYWKVCAYDSLVSGTVSGVRRVIYGGRSWTDDPLSPHAPFRDEYITELRQELNYALRFRGMSTNTWTDDPIVPYVTRIRDDHIMELRAAAVQIVTNTGCATNSINWTDDTLVPGTTPFRRQHIEELRAIISLF